MIKFWVGIIAFYLIVFIAFTLLMRVSDKEERRQRCMMNHPAGSLAKTEHSPSGQISPDSTLTERERVGAQKLLKLIYGENRQRQYSSGLSSSHRLEAD